MADIEAEIERMFRCHCGHRGHSAECIHGEPVADYGDHHWGCPVVYRPAMADFCRKLVAGRDSQLSELHKCAKKWADATASGGWIDNLRKRVVELEQEDKVANDVILTAEALNQSLRTALDRKAAIVVELEQENEVARKLVAAQLKAIELVESQLAAMKSERKD